MRGKITISRYSNSDETDPIHITIEEVDSSIQFVDVSMTLEDFAQALTGLGFVDCGLTFRALDKIGKIREHKVEPIYIGDRYNFTEEESKELIKPFEVDGWIGRDEDLRNSHNQTKDRKHRNVVFVRWV